MRRTQHKLAIVFVLTMAGVMACFLQVGNYMNPLQANLTHLNYMLIHAEEELGLGVENNDDCFISPPGESHVLIYNHTAAMKVRWKVSRGCLSPADLVRVAANPMMKRRWVETWQVAAPLLADFERIVTTFGHLGEPLQLSETVGHLPFDFGHNWDDVFLGSFGVFQNYVTSWMRMWSSVYRRWDADDFEILQPRLPSMFLPFLMASIAMSILFGKKHMQLQGATSSGQGQAALAAMKTANNDAQSANDNEET
jgi:hypothetical protein